MTPTTPEGRVVASVLRVLGLLRIPHKRNNTGAAMLTGRGGKPRPVFFGAPGWPDIEAVLPPTGQYLGIECKRADQRPKLSANQRATAKEIMDAGGLYWVVQSADEVIAALRAQGVRV